MKRRSFFTSLAKAAAIVALAPQLAFRAKPIKVALPEPPPTCVAYWTQMDRFTHYYDDDYIAALKFYADNKK